MDIIAVAEENIEKNATNVVVDLAVASDGFGGKTKEINNK